MQLERKTVDEQLDSFESYIERGGEARALLRPTLEQTRTFVEGVFQGSDVINDEKIEQICSHLDGVVSNLRESGCEEEVIIHIQAVRSEVWLALKNNGKKRNSATIPEPEEIKRFDGVIPYDLQHKFERYEEFSLDIVSQQWCQWILDQLGESSFERISVGCNKKIIIFPSQIVQFESLLSHRITKRINQSRLLSGGIRFTPANARTVLRHVHEGRSLRESVQTVIHAKTTKEVQSASILIPTDLQKKFERHEGFSLDIVSQQWCQWILDQLGEKSFKNVKTRWRKRILIYPGKIVQLNSFLIHFPKNTINQSGWLPKGVQFTAANARTVLRHVHEGMSLRDAIELVVQEIQVSKAAEEAKLASIPIPEDLQKEFEKHEQFCLELVTPRWCQWILDQLGESSFERISVGCNKKIIIFPSQIVQFDSFLIHSTKNKINQSGWLPKGVQFTAANTKMILQYVHEEKSLRGAVKFVAQKIEARRAKKAELACVPIPEDLQKKFERHKKFCLGVVNQQWCQWILDQLGEDSFEGVSVRCDRKVLIFPGQIISFYSLLGYILKNEIGQNGWLPEGIQFKGINTKAVLQHVHEGKDFKEAIALVAAEIEQAEETRQEAEVEEKERKQLEGDLIEFFEDIKEGATAPDAKAIRYLVSLFGGAGFIDIFFLYHPRYRGLGAERVEGIIGEYLGDFLLNIPFIPPHLPDDLPSTMPPELQEMLFHALKNEALAYCNTQIRLGSKSDKLDMILDYLALKEEILNSRPYLKTIKERALQYYERLFHDLKKPDHMVDYLDENRLFPDLSQLVNIMETSIYKRLLIADEMGLGKSNSAISTKEFLGLKRSLIVMPSSVIDTWGKYLSDEIDENGNQVGYFKPGQAPNVLIVESLSDLRDNDLSSYDYILISHERLSDRCIHALLEIDFDHLIVDEVHKLKNLLNGKRGKNLVRLAIKNHGEGVYLSLLSGTPVPNKVKDVALILRLLYPDKFASMSDIELIQLIIKGDLLKTKAELHMRMQMKELATSIDLPERTDKEIYVDFSDEEADLYEALLEEDELTASEKIMLLRLFCLNHQYLETFPTIPSSKITALNHEINEALEAGGKVIVFVNDFIEGVLRNNKGSSSTIFDHLSLPSGTEICIVDGSTSRKEKNRIQEKLNNGNKQIIVFINGMVSDVGVDYTGATHVIHLNEPWTKFGKDQQIARTYRPGLSHPITATTLRFRNSFEEVQYEYMKKKYRAIQKLLRGIPISDIEARILEDKEDGRVPELNPELAKEYLSKVQRFNRMLGAMKQIGEEKFREYLKTEAESYADIYRVLGTRSYHGNNTRVTSALLSSMIAEQDQSIESLRILDIASGPKMLQQHSTANLGSRVISLDINPRHFKDPKANNVIIGSFLDIPVESGSMNYCVMGFAFDYTRLVKRENNYERIQALAEINRVLKPGGRAIISMAYSTGMKNMNLFKEAVEALGFKMVEKYTGEVGSGSNYCANYFTLEKISHIELADGKVDMDAILSKFKNGMFKGLKFKGNKKALRKQRHMISNFQLNGASYDIEFNKDDQKVKDEEQKIYELVDRLLEQYGNVKNIPVEVLAKSGFTRYRISQGNYRLFKPLKTASGVIVV